MNFALSESSTVVRNLRRIEKCRVYGAPEICKDVMGFCNSFGKKILLKRRIERLMNRIKRLAVLVFTLKKGKSTGVVGHTLMQKLFYLLQCGEGVELGYKYKLHYYGPYSRELWSDLNLLANEKVVNIEANPNGYGYKIELLEGENTNLLLNEVDKNIKEKFLNF